MSNVFCLQKSKNYGLFKQFVVTNCSKERPGSIVTETLKNGILIPIVTSKESHFNVVSFICLNLENRGKHPLKVIQSQRKSYDQIQCIRDPYCRSFKCLSTTIWNFAFLARRQITDACLFVFFCFFFQVWLYRLSGLRMSREGSFWRKLKVLVPFSSDRKNWRAPRPHPTLIFPKNSEIAILFTIVEQSNNNDFRDDLLPRRPHGRGCKLQTLTCVYI